MTRGTLLGWRCRGYRGELFGWREAFSRFLSHRWALLDQMHALDPGEGPPRRSA
jgi:hypothetical protein